MRGAHNVACAYCRLRLMGAFGHSIRHRKIYTHTHTGFRLQFRVYLKRLRRSNAHRILAAKRQRLSHSVRRIARPLSNVFIFCPSDPLFLPLSPLSLPLSLSSHLINRKQKWCPTFAVPLSERKQSLRINHLIFCCRRSSSLSLLIFDGRSLASVPLAHAKVKR